jgi:ubiquinol-cytochrome c reductase iron-sulfur subunit
MSAKNEVDEVDEVDEARRCFLRRATTTVGGIGLAASAIPFISYWMPSVETEEAGGPVQVDISQLKPTEQLTVAWRGQPIWVIRRTQAMLDSLPKLNSLLRDPNSDEDQQPSYAKNIYRAIKPEYFVAIGVCTHLGCIPTYRPDVGGVSPDWLGGFYCPCHGSIYDLAGRVFKGVPAPKNLVIPPYQYLNDSTVLIGQDSEGTVS